MSSSNAPKQRLQMKVRILHALERLLANKEYSKIEINDICNEAHISKPTFYRYFKNKDNIFRWMTKVGFRCGIVEIGRRYTWYEGYLVSLMVAYRHRAFYSEKQNPELISNLVSLSWEYQYEALCDTLAMHKDKELTERLSFLFEATAKMQCHMSLKWGAEGMSVPPEIMADYLASSAPSEVFELFNEPLIRREGFAEEISLINKNDEKPLL